MAFGGFVQAPAVCLWRLLSQVHRMEGHCVQDTSSPANSQYRSFDSLGLLTRSADDLRKVLSGSGGSKAIHKHSHVSTLFTDQIQNRRSNKCEVAKENPLSDGLVSFPQSKSAEDDRRFYNHPRTAAQCLPHQNLYFGRMASQRSP